MKMVELGDLFSIKKGKKATETSTGARYIQIGDLRNNDNIKFAEITDNVVLCDEDDILIAWDGANAGTIGYSLSGIIGSTLAKLTPKKNIVNSIYAGRFLQSKFSYLRRNCTGATIPHISRPSLIKLKIPLPPLPVQKHIAAILDQADELRQKDQQLIDHYDQLSQSLFLDMFGDPVTNPKGWEKVKMSHLTQLITDGKHGNCSDQENSGYYFISAKNISRNKINYENARQITKAEFEEVDRRTNLQHGDLVMVNTGATIGKMAIVEDIPETRKTTFQKSVAIIKPTLDLLDVFFLKNLFKIRLEEFSGKGSGSAIKNLLLSEMRRFKLITPPINLQNEFAERVQAIEQQKQQAEEAARYSEELFQSLLQRAFKGELVKEEQLV